MSMKIWVDDIRTAPEGWHHARTVTEAIRVIGMFPEEITHISLDHDISYQVEVAGVSRPFPSPEDFSAVAYYIVMALMGPWKISVHSANPVGAKKILAILKEGGIKAEYKPMGPANRLEMEV